MYPALLPLMPHNSAASSRLNWRPSADLNGLANAVGSQYPSHYLGTWCIQHYYHWCAHLGCQQSTELTPHGRFKWTQSVSRERRNLVSARVPWHFNWPVPLLYRLGTQQFMRTVVTVVPYKVILCIGTQELRFCPYPAIHSCNYAYAR